MIFSCSPAFLLTWLESLTRRCGLDKSEIQTVFKLVNLLADFPNTTYILGFDDKRVADEMVSVVSEEREAEIQGIVVLRILIPMAGIRQQILPRFLLKGFASR